MKDILRIAKFSAKQYILTSCFREYKKRLLS